MKRKNWEIKKRKCKKKEELFQMGVRKKKKERRT